MTEFTKLTSVADIVKACPTARRVFDKYGLKGCGGEHGPTEALEFFAAVHNVDVDALVRELNAEMRNPSKEEYVYQESLGDFIYRRFFKAGIAIVLSVGALWGAINLLQIAQGGTFLQVRLVPAIQAHAHAMIFGWMGLFVMGFAYQSFPRFKYVTLWRADLANLTLYLMLIGIASRVGAEMLQPMPVGVGLGILAAATELAAITLFIVIILKTAQQSVEPHQIYEKFIFGAFFWFFVQAIVSDILFFAKVTAAGVDQLVMRIALIDGPLRDIQLLGFGALIIAGVSQRFVPAVYGLGKPRHDRQSLIFWLINGSLILDVASYVLLFSTGNLYFSIGLELAFILMAVWAVLLVMQIRVFAKTSETDRSLKFIRAAYAWLLISMAMLPILSGLRRADPPGLFPRFHGFVPACLHGGLRQHDDSGSGVAGGAHPGGRGFQAHQLALGPLHSFQRGVRRTRGAANPHRFHSQRGFSTGGSDGIHRGDGARMVGRGTVAHHESLPDASRQIAARPAAGGSTVTSAPQRPRAAVGCNPNELLRDLGASRGRCRGCPFGKAT